MKMRREREKEEKLEKQSFSLRGNSSGFSLVEIMVAAGMLGVLSVGIMQVMKQMNKGTKTIEQKSTESNLHNQLYNSLRSKTSCTRTLLGQSRSSTPISLDQIYAGGNEQETDPTKYRVVVEKGEVYGNGAGRITVTDITFGGYGAKPKGVTDEPAGIIGGPSPREYGQAYIGVTFTKGDPSKITNEDSAKSSSYGSYEKTVYYPVQIMVDQATDNIIDCYGTEDTVVEAGCNSLGGTIDPVDGNCKNLNVEANPLTITDIYPLRSKTNADGTMLGHINAEGGIVVGVLTDPTLAPLSGVLHANRGATIGYVVGDASFDHNSDPGLGNLNVFNGASVRGLDATTPFGLGVGAAAPVGAGSLHVTGGASFTNDLATFPIPAVGSVIIQDNLTVGNNTGVPATTTGDIQVNRSVGIGEAPSGAYGELRVQGDARFTAGDVDVTAGKIFIRNQAPGFLTTGAVNSGTERFEAATKGWVNRNVFGSGTVISNGERAAIIGSIMNYAQHQPLNTIKANLCTSTRVSIDGSTPISGTYTGGTGYSGSCLFTVTSSDCTINGNCNGAGPNSKTLYATTFNGAQFTGGNFNGVNFTGTGYGSFTDYIQANRFCIGSSAFTNCITRVRSACPGGQVAIGWYNGFLECN